MNGRKLIVLSADAMVFEDMKLMRTLPNFKKYLEGGAGVERIRSIYPSITYPCHVTMSTGAYPDRHGVVSNFDIQINQSPMPWTWFHHFVQTEDIFTAAKRAGLSTAAVFWPVTGNHPDIDHLIAEYWTQGENDTPLKAFARAGSNEDMLRIIDNNLPKLVERVHPQCDNFIVGCCCDIIRNHMPDLLMLHPANVDSYRHQFGLFNDKVDAGLYETDCWIGEIMQAVEDIGELENTTLVLTSDHGQITVGRVIHPNVVLAENGLIELDSQGLVTHWDAYCLSNGLSALVFLRDKSDVKLYTRVRQLLDSLCKQGIYGIEQVFTAEETKVAEHLDGDFSFVLEADPLTSFGSNCEAPLMTPCDNQDYRYGRASHGHIPDKGPHPTFWAKGLGIRPNTTLSTGRLVDEAPTYAKLLGFSLDNADGSPMLELLIP